MPFRAIPDVCVCVCDNVIVTYIGLLAKIHRLMLTCAPSLPDSRIVYISTGSCLGHGFARHGAKCLLYFLTSLSLNLLHGTLFNVLPETKNQIQNPIKQSLKWVNPWWNLHTLKKLSISNRQLYSMAVWQFFVVFLFQFNLMCVCVLSLIHTVTTTAVSWRDPACFLLMQSAFIIHLRHFYWKTPCCYCWCDSSVDIPSWRCPSRDLKIFRDIKELPPLVQT